MTKKSLFSHPLLISTSLPFYQSTSLPFYFSTNPPIYSSLITVYKLRDYSFSLDNVEAP